MSTRLHTHSDPPAAVCPKPGNGPRAWGQMLTARRHTLVWDARGPARSHSDLDHCPLQRLSGGSRHLLFCPLLSFHNSAREGFWKLSFNLQLKKQRLRERWLTQGHWDNSRGVPPRGDGERSGGGGGGGGGGPLESLKNPETFLAPPCPATLHVARGSCRLGEPVTGPKSFLLMTLHLIHPTRCGKADGTPRTASRAARRCLYR